MADIISNAEAELENETRQRFINEYLQDKTDKYDSRDVERLQKDDVLAGCYLQWRLQNVDDTLKMIDESFQWRKEFRVNDLTECSIPRWMFETGAVYLHGYDKEGNKDMDFVKYIINCFKVYYPKFLSKMILYEMPWIMSAAWRIVKNWLGPEAISKLKFVGKNEVQEYIDAEHLPTHMGGTDTFKYSYPPLPDDDFQTPMCENGPIVSEDETESKEDAESESKDTLDSSQNEEQIKKSKKVSFPEESLKLDECDKVDSTSRTKTAKKPVTVFKGQLLHIRLRCHVTQSSKPMSLLLDENPLHSNIKNNQEDLHSKIIRLLASNKRCEEQIDECLWFQKMLMGLVSLLMAIMCSALYLLYTDRSRL
ncbi:UNVERIFIED_CONTAM: hypothetical protein FKN15_024798 [Acipenser sinensis]